MPSNSSLFISTVSAKQMARETELCTAIIHELNQLLSTERARNETLTAQLHAAKASARTQRRKAERAKAHSVERDQYALELSDALEEEKQRADEFAEDYTNLARRYQYRLEDCDILRARCEEREKELCEMRARAQQVAEEAAAERDQLLINSATRKQLMDMMQAIPPEDQLLPVPPCLNPEEENSMAARERELNTMKLTNPLKFYLGDGEKYMREFLGSWRWYHKRLPGEGVTPISGTPIPGWGGEGADDEADDKADEGSGEGTTAGVFECHCCDCDDADTRDT